jgi:hypothetical protein
MGSDRIENGARLSFARLSVSHAGSSLTSPRPAPRPMFRRAPRPPAINFAAGGQNALRKALYLVPRDPVTPMSKLALASAKISTTKTVSSLD